MLHKFAKTFPDSPLTDFIDDYCRWFKLPLPEPEDEPETENGENQVKEEKTGKKEKAQRWRRKKKGPNAKERRKARRQAGKEGVLAEDLDQEEKEELVSSMTVSSCLLMGCPDLITLETARQAQAFTLCSQSHGKDLDPRGRLGQCSILCRERSNHSQGNREGSRDPAQIVSDTDINVEHD